MKKLFTGLLFLAFAAGIRAQSTAMVNRSASKPGSTTTAKKRLNVVFFLVDDMGWSDLGIQGSKFYETPNIDRFARENVRFTQAYAACHVCSPTRASIISGSYPARLHLTDWLPGRKEFSFQKLKNADHVQHLPYGQLTLPEILRENGYATAIIGKWHLGMDSASTQRQGFDLHIPDYNVGWPNGTYFSPYHMKGLEGGPDGEYLTDRITDEALKWIENNKDHPFFLYLAHFAVHDPIEGRPDLVEKYEKKLKQMPAKHGSPFVLEENPDSPDPLGSDQLNDLLLDERYAGFGNLPDRVVKVKQFQDNPQYAAMVESVDESMKRVLDKLKALGLDDNTVVIFFCDNGGMSAMNIGNPARRVSAANLDKAYSTSNLPLRGGKGWLYEGGIREPLIVHWPHQDKPGVCNVPVISTDFLPTILDMAGIQVPKQYSGDGMSFTALLKDPQSDPAPLEKRALYWHFPQYSNHGAQSPGGAIRYGDYKLIEYFENYKVQLFNLKDDPGEQNDLAASEPGKVKELRDMLHAWRKQVNANMPTPNPDYDPSLHDQWQNWVKPAAKTQAPKTGEE
ncbi:MAG TPA: sulfatase [Puia sp.]|nr:sulfatase [Puia sp.]